MTEHVWYYYPVYEENVHHYQDEQTMLKQGVTASQVAHPVYPTRMPVKPGENFGGNFNPNQGFNHGANNVGPNNQWNQWPNNQWNNHGNPWGPNHYDHNDIYAPGHYPYPPYNPMGGVAPFLVGGLTGAAIAGSNQPQNGYYPYPPQPYPYPVQPYPTQGYPATPYPAGSYVPYGSGQQ